MEGSREKLSPLADGHILYIKDGVLRYLSKRLIYNGSYEATKCDGSKFSYIFQKCISFSTGNWYTLDVKALYSVGTYERVGVNGYMRMCVQFSIPHLHF